MEENKFWYKIWKLVAIALVLIISSFAGCESYRMHKISTVIEKGIDPMEARCAINPRESDTLCHVIATKRQN